MNLQLPTKWIGGVSAMQLASIAAVGSVRNWLTIAVAQPGR